MNAAEIQQMSWEEKLRTLEELWEAIVCEVNSYESPGWHQEVLKETQKRAEAGSE